MFLTDEEIANLTGEVRPSMQAKWLAKVGVPFVKSANGRPVVARAAVADFTPAALRQRMTLDFSADGDPVRWPAPAYAALSIEELRALPEVGKAAKVCGVYFLWMGDELAYIGSSANVRSRVGGHCSDPKTRFNRATYLAVEWPWQFAIEAIYIRAYRPQGNSTHAGQSFE